ncbi:hypothetical protein GCM10007079_28380 [Nocardiopsis terrae]|nr:hypothetical protein GCM10007079_28380 [Nocardiopsis terrae]
MWLCHTVHREERFVPGRTVRRARARSGTSAVLAEWRYFSLSGWDGRGGRSRAEAGLCGFSRAFVRAKRLVRQA